jgi:hypothetical protein
VSPRGNECSISQSWQNVMSNLQRWSSSTTLRLKSRARLTSIQNAISFIGRIEFLSAAEHRRGIKRSGAPVKRTAPPIYREEILRQSFIGDICETH